MKISVFAVGADGSEGGVDELNTFLATHRVLSVEKALVTNPGGGAYWSFAVSWLDGPNPVKLQGRPSAGPGDRTDYKHELSEDDFALFVKLRDLRKRLALDEGVPMYMVFTNAQLAEMAKARCDSKAGLKRIEGIGDARIEKYGGTFLEMITAHAKDGETTGENSGPRESAARVLEGGATQA